MGGSAFPRRLPTDDDRPALGHIISTASSLRRSHVYNGFLMEFRDLSHARTLKDAWWGKAFQFSGFKVLQSTNGAFSFKFAAGLSYFNRGEGSKKASGNEGVSNPKSSTTDPYLRRHLTNALIAINVSAYIADIKTDGKINLWGAKDNHLIRKGQWWRLVTCSFLHLHSLHLLLNCYSLYHSGPPMETICGPKRYLAVYFTSAIAGSGLSYCFQKKPMVGSSGAIFGLVGSFAAYVMRHGEYMDGGGREELEVVACVLALNAAFGLYFAKYIDNWAHLGGFFGGAAATWVLGPAFKYESQTTAQGKRIYEDRPPIPYLVSSKAEPLTLKSKP